MKLDGRTLYKNGDWNTICLPFTVTLEGSPLEGATAKTLTEATMTGTHVTLSFGPDVTTLQANTPYIIKWDANSGANITDPVFTNATVVSRSAADRTITRADGHVKFIGYYSAFDIDEYDTDIYYMTAGDTLKHTGKERTLKACRAYFQFSEAAQARQLVLDFGEGETQGVSSLASESSHTPTPSPRGERNFDGQGSVFTLSGVKVHMGSGPLRKGLYVKDGRKVMVNH